MAPGTGVEQGHIGEHFAADHFKIQEFSHKGIHHGLEDHGRNRRGLVRLDFDRVACRIGAGLPRHGFGPGGEPDQAVQQLVDAFELLRRTAEHRRDFTPADAGRQALDPFLGREVLAGEILFHQLFIGLRDRLVDRGAQAVQAMPHVGSGRSTALPFSYA